MQTQCPSCPHAPPGHLWSVSLASSLTRPRRGWAGAAEGMCEAEPCGASSLLSASTCRGDAAEFPSGSDCHLSKLSHFGAGFAEQEHGSGEKRIGFFGSRGPMRIFIFQRCLGLTCPCLSCHKRSSISPTSVVLCSHSVCLGVGRTRGDLSHQNQRKINLRREKNPKKTKPQNFLSLFFNLPQILIFPANTKKTPSKLSLGEQRNTPQLNKQALDSSAARWVRGVISPRPSPETLGQSHIGPCSENFCRMPELGCGRCLCLAPSITVTGSCCCCWEHPAPEWAPGPPAMCWGGLARGNEECEVRKRVWSRLC